MVTGVVYINRKIYKTFRVTTNCLCVEQIHKRQICTISVEIVYSNRILFSLTLLQVL